MLAGERSIRLKDNQWTWRWKIYTTNTNLQRVKIIILRWTKQS
jgi:hypothetical protein